MRLWLRAALFLILLGLPSSALAQTTNYPGSVDDTSTLCDPTPTAQTNGACKAAENAAAQNHAIIGLEDKVGTGASTPQAGYLLEGTGTGTSAYTAPGTAITPAPTATPANTATPIPADTPVPTATPIPPVATATPEAQAFDFTTATPVAGCVLYDSVGGGTSSVVGCATVLPSSTPASTATPRPTDTPIPAPTAYPTLAVGEIVVGTGGQGVQDGKAALTTATAIAGGFLYDSAGGASSVISYVTAVPTATIIATATPRATDTPAPTATPASGTAYKLLGKGVATTDQSITSTSSPGTDITSLTTTVTPNGVNDVRITVHLGSSFVATGGSTRAIYVLILKGAGPTTLQTCSLDELGTIAANQEFFVNCAYIDAAPAASSTVYKAAAYITGGTLHTVSTGPSQNFLTAEQIG